jgi:inosine-uridine nucleoside N-ribohydrolase
MVTDLLTFYGDAWAHAGGDGGPPVHDPCALARVARPDLVGVRDAFVAVETRGAWTTGMTVVDFTGRLGQAPNAKVAVDLDRGGLWDLLVGAVATLSR